MDYIAQVMQLDALLNKLQAQQIDSIEYGEPGQPAGYFSYIRIRWIGGQYCIKEIHRGMEGSGDYCGNVNEYLKLKLVQKLTHYHRETWVRPLLEAHVGLKRPTELSFFANEREHAS